MKKVSIVITSLRASKLEKLIDSTQQYREDIEVIIASPYPPKPRDFVIHIPVPNIDEPGELTFTQKVNLAFKQASGEYIVFCNDDYLFNEEWLPAFLSFMDENKNARHPFLAAFCQSHNGVVNKIGVGAFGFRHPNFGGMSKADFDKLGGFVFDENIYMHYGDVDLGVRVWDSGGEVKLCDTVILSSRDSWDGIRQYSRTRWQTHDGRIFFDKWFHKYGKTVNRDLSPREIHELLRLVNGPMDRFETTDWQGRLALLLRPGVLRLYILYKDVKALPKTITYGLLRLADRIPIVNGIKRNIGKRFSAVENHRQEVPR